MFAFFTPMVWRAIAAALVLAALTVLYLHWKNSIIKETEDRVNAEWVQRQKLADDAASAALLAKNTEIAKKEAALKKTQETIVSQSKELQNAKQDYQNLRDKYAIGAKRLSINTVPDESDRAKQSDDPASAAGTEQDGATQYLVPELSIEILDFARRYEENLRLKNECIDLYNAARDAVNPE